MTPSIARLGEHARPVHHLAVSGEALGLRLLALRPLVVLGVDGEDAACPVAEVEHERGVERDEVARVGGVEPSGRVREAELAHRAGHVRPPRVHRAIRECEVRGEITEEVEGERR